MFFLRSRDGGGLGTRDWASHDIRRCADYPDLGHRSRNESTGNSCMFAPLALSLLRELTDLLADTLELGTRERISRTHTIQQFNKHSSEVLKLWSPASGLVT